MSGLSNPIPSADVATTTLTRLSGKDCSISGRSSDSVLPLYATAAISFSLSHPATRSVSLTVRQYTTPVPSRCLSSRASRVSRSAWDGISKTCSRRPDRVNGPRTRESRDPSWAVTSSITRLFAVAVQHSIGTPGRRGRTLEMRR